MSAKRLLAILFIYCCTAVAWFILAGAIESRTGESLGSTATAVNGNWGPAMTQQHPVAYYESPGAAGGRAAIRPVASNVTVDLSSDPKRKGLMWYRTYLASFHGEYTFENPTPIPQTVYVQFALPTAAASYNEFSFLLNDRPTTANISGGAPITEAVTLEPGGKAVLAVAYKTRGLNRWSYAFGQDSRVQNFLLRMHTDFYEIDFPEGSPSKRNDLGNAWDLEWSYPDEIGPRGIAMDMPKVLNPGPTAARISFFSPVSLLFFFAVLIVACLLHQVNLHPMHFFFLGAGCFAFQLLFAYLVDLVPIGFAFGLSALVSLILVSGYLLMAFGAKFARIAALAQFGYMVLFSYSFFFDGLTGLTITIGAIVTLAILMVATAKTNWTEKFNPPPVIPPPMPERAH